MYNVRLKTIEHYIENNKSLVRTALEDFCPDLHELKSVCESSSVVLGLMGFHSDGVPVYCGDRWIRLQFDNAPYINKLLRSYLNVNEITPQISGHIKKLEKDINSINSLLTNRLVGMSVRQANLAVPALQSLSPVFNALMSAESIKKDRKMGKKAQELYDGLHNNTDLVMLLGQGALLTDYDPPNEINIQEY